MVLNMQRSCKQLQQQLWDAVHLQNLLHMREVFGEAPSRWLLLRQIEEEEEKEEEAQNLEIGTISLL